MLKMDAVCIGEKANSYKVTGGTSQEFGRSWLWLVLVLSTSGETDVARAHCTAILRPSGMHADVVDCDTN